MKHRIIDGERYVSTNYTYTFGDWQFQGVWEPDPVILLDYNQRELLHCAQFVVRNGCKYLRMVLKDGRICEYPVAHGMPFKENARVDIGTIGVYKSDHTFTAQEAELPE